MTLASVALRRDEERSGARIVRLMAADLASLRRSHCDLEQKDLLALGWTEPQIRAFWQRALETALAAEGAAP